MAAGQKKFGTFAGVFTPSILTILGVIMYLRLGWVVGNAGLAGAVLIVLIAHVISVTTGLSISSIATDKKIGAGGVYYVLSRSLGLPIGGAIGLTLFTGTALSISLYLVGFSESFNAYLGIPASANSLRITGSVALLALTAIAFISTSIAIKTQYLILTAIAVSLVAIFAGHSPFPVEHPPAFGGEGSASMELVFAIFFPAVTGFTAGIAMSGDLQDPKKSIPIGTIGAIAAGFVIYLSLVLYVGLNVQPEILRSDNSIMMKIALFAPAVVAGIWGATLSSALGGILGGPRILQAMSVDKITPRIFGIGMGKNKEPRNALLLTVLLAESGILIGELDLIARIVSMFYLAAYGFINIAFFLERWASTDFNPSFKVNKWVGLVGFAATFAVMFKLDMLAMFAAFAIISGIYIWLAKKEIALGTGDVWQSVWSSVVKSGLRRMATANDHKRNWKPNILLFSGSSESRPHLLEFAQCLAGRTGLITNFDLVENEKAVVLFPKHEQTVQDELLQRFDIFGRRIEVQNIFKGIETIATTFGFSGLDPNTVLMGWAKNTNDPIWFAQMTRRLIDLDYNVLYLDYDKRWGFRKKEQIDLWFHEAGNNPELMLHLAKFISKSADWRNAAIRILVVNDYNVDRIIIESRIQKLLDEYRLQAEIRVINNQTDPKPFYEIMKVLSADADLIFLGIPDIKPGEEALFVQQTNDLVSVIGTTLLVKASASTFPIIPLGLVDIGAKPLLEELHQDNLIPLTEPEDPALTAALHDIDHQWHTLGEELADNTFGVIQQHYAHFFTSVKEQVFSLIKQVAETPTPEGIERQIKQVLTDIERLSSRFAEDELEALRNLLQSGIQRYLKGRTEVLKNTPASLRLAADSNRKIRWRHTLHQFERENILSSLLIALREHSSVHAGLFDKCHDLITRNLNPLLALPPSPENTVKQINSAQKLLKTGFAALQNQTQAIVNVPMNHLRNSDRIICNRSVEAVRTPSQSNNQLPGYNQDTAIPTEIGRYPNTWLQHQELFHSQFQTGLRLDRVNIGIKKVVGEALQQVRLNYFEGMQQQIVDLKELSHTIGQTAKKEKSLSLPVTEPGFEEESSVNTELITSQLINTISLLSDALPEATDIFDAQSRKTFPAFERGQIREVVLAVRKIADYLIETTLLDHFDQKLTALSTELRKFKSDVFNTITKLNYSLNKARDDKDLDALQVLLIEVGSELDGLSAQLEKMIQQFEADIRERTDATATMLDIRNMISQSNTLKQYAGKKAVRGLRTWLEDLKQEINRRRNQVLEYVTRRRDDLLVAGYENRYQTLQSDHARLRNFMEEISMLPEVEAAVPLYYRHLFSGKHLSPGAHLDNRKRQVVEAEKALRYIREGIPGAIMIAGESLAGKSFFTDFVANRLIPGKTFYITAPPGGGSSESDLAKAIQSACGRKTAVKTIFQALPPGTTFIFNDIELWWLKAPGGNQLINKVAALIRQFSSRHYFLLNCNLHTLPLILKSTALAETLVNTIVLPPVSQEVLKKVVWSRHQNGGVPLVYQGNLFSGVLATPPEKIFARLFQLSNGNIGAAMRIWLASLRMTPAGDLALIYPERYELPGLNNTALNNFLTQIFIHRGLSQSRLHQIYAFEGPDWVEQMIGELKKANILEFGGIGVRDAVISLRPEVRPYLERWLNEQEYL